MIFDVFLQENKILQGNIKNPKVCRGKFFDLQLLKEN